MKQIILKKMEKDYQLELSKQKVLRAKEEELKNILKEYNSLSEEIESLKKSMILPNGDGFTILEKVRDKYFDEIDKDNNELYVYCVSLTPDDGNFTVVPRNSDNEVFRKYINLESGEKIRVFKDDFDSFEDINNVIIPEDTSFTRADYDLFSAKFLTIAMKEGEDSAIDKAYDYFMPSSKSKGSR